MNVPTKRFCSLGLGPIISFGTKQFQGDKRERTAGISIPPGRKHSCDFRPLARASEKWKTPKGADSRFARPAAIFGAPALNKSDFRCHI